MSDKDNEIPKWTPSNFGAFVPIEDGSESDNDDDEEEIGKYKALKRLCNSFKFL